MLADGTRAPYDPKVFSNGSAGALGRCSWRNRHRQGPNAYECGPPVVMEWRTRVLKNRSGIGGAWYSLCHKCAESHWKGQA